MTRQRAHFRNEGTGVHPWFVYLELENGTRHYVLRFDDALNACAVSEAINDALRAEGRFLISEEVSA